MHVTLGGMAASAFDAAAQATFILRSSVFLYICSLTCFLALQNALPPLFFLFIAFSNHTLTHKQYFPSGGFLARLHLAVSD